MAEELPDLGLGQTLRSFASGQKVFGRYTLARILGRGGMGVVWLARDEQLEVDVALKFLPELLALDPGAIDDMKRETRRSRELSHRNIVKVYHFEQAQELAAISMEHVDGESLAKLKVDQAGKCFSHTHLGPWLLELADALDYAHSEAKMVHRDLKPANVMLNNRGRIKITDFGIASSIADSVSQLSVGRGSSGTPPYMSPQQAAGRTAQPVDDIYSLGATIYDLMTGKPPFYSGNIHHQVENIVPPSMAERRTALGNSAEPIPDNWEQTIAACLSKDPAERPASAAEVIERLELKARSVLKAVPISAAATPRKRVAPVLITSCVVLLLLAGVGYYFALIHRSKRMDTVTAVRPSVSVAPRESPRVAPSVAAAPAIVLATATPEATAVPILTSTPPVATGSIAVSTQPVGARVSIGDQTGKTPVTLSGLALGKQTLKVALDGYEPVERDIDVKENETTDLGNLTLERSRGSAQITSTPQGISFELVDADGDHHKGKTPATVETLATGEAKIIFKSKRSPNHEQQIVIARNQAATAEWESAPVAQRSATSQEGKAVGENAASNIPPGIKKLLGTFPLTKRSSVMGFAISSQSGILTASLSIDGKSVSIVGHYAETVSLGNGAISLRRGSFHKSVPTAKFADGTEIGVAGTFTETLKSKAGATTYSASSASLWPGQKLWSCLGSLSSPTDSSKPPVKVLFER